MTGLIKLNVGGVKFDTTKTTLTSTPTDNFFTALLSGNFSTLHVGYLL